MEKEKKENIKAGVVKEISDIKINEELYPRRGVDEEMIQSYAENIDVLPPIVINQDDVLIDGQHRLKGHEQAGVTEIECIVEHTKNEEEIYRRAVELNATHGKQLSNREKKDVAVRLFNGDNKKELIKLLSVSPDCLNKWVRDIAKEKAEQFEEKIIQEYLHAEMTEQRVADKLDTSIRKVSETKSKFYEKINTLIRKRKKDEAPGELKEKYWDIYNFKPFHSNIWKVYETDVFDDKVVEVDEGRLNLNLLHYYAKPFDIVYAPENEWLINACKTYYRRYFTGNNPNVKPNLAVLDGSNDIEPIVNLLKSKMKEGHIVIKIHNMTQDSTVFTVMRKFGCKLENRIIIPLAEVEENGELQHGYDSLLVFAVK